MSRRKFFIDTDAGTDDAVALIMVIRNTDIDIIGISAVCGNVGLDKVVQNIGYVCELCSVSIPYYAGSPTPLNQALIYADFIHGKDGLGDIGLDLSGRDAHSDDAIGALISAIQEHPNELELICLGPLTNIAHLVTDAPTILKSVKKIVIMGGLVNLPGNVTPLAEFNIWADPEAAAIVLATIQEQNVACTMIGWDSTLKSSNLTMGELESYAAIPGPLSKFATAIQGPRIKWLKEQKMDVTINLADVLAMAVALDDSIVQQRGSFRMKVDTGQQNPTRRGYIKATAVFEPPFVDFIHEVDRDRYMSMIRSCLEERTEI